MPVLKPKSRTISFRLSEEEYDLIHQASVLQGARSVSDFARDNLCRLVAPTREPIEARVNQLSDALESLDGQLRSLQQKIVNPV